jgi:hypothetical protein
MTFITDLDWAQKLTPEFRDNLEIFLPKWLDSLVPYYKEGKEQSIDVLRLSNFLPNGCDTEETMYENNGIAYYLHLGSWGLKTLGFDTTKGYRKCNWLECYIEEHPDYDTCYSENRQNFMYYNFPMSRMFNQRPKEKDLAERCDAYFKNITGDPGVGFSLSYTSMIYYNNRGKNYIDYYCIHD